MSLICWGMFILLRDDIARVGAAEKPACNDKSVLIILGCYLFQKIKIWDDNKTKSAFNVTISGSRQMLLLCF